MPKISRNHVEASFPNVQLASITHSRFTVGSVARSSLLVMLGLLITRGSNVLIRVILGRTLGPENLGIVSTVWSLVAMLGVIAAVGIPPTVTRFLALYVHQERLAFVRALLHDSFVWILVVAGGLAGLTAAFSPTIAAKWLGDPALSSLVLAGTLAIPAWAFLFWVVAVFRGLGETAPSIFSKDILRSLLALSALALLWKRNALDVSTAVQFVYIAPTVVACWTGILLVWRRITPFLRTGEYQAERRQWVRFAWPVSLSMLLQNTTGRNIDILILGYLTSANDVGLYVSALSLVGVSGLVLQGVNYLALPLFTNGTEHTRSRNLGQIRLLTFELTLPVTLVLMLWPDLLTQLTFGKAFSGAVLGIPVLAAGYAVSNFLGPVGQRLLAEGRTRWHLLVDLASVVSFFLLALTLIPLLGVVGAAIARSVSQIVANITAALPFGRKAIKIPAHLLSTLMGVVCIIWAFRIITAIIYSNYLYAVVGIFASLFVSYVWLLFRLRREIVAV